MSRKIWPIIPDTSDLGADLMDRVVAITGRAPSMAELTPHELGAYEKRLIKRVDAIAAQWARKVGTRIVKARATKKTPRRSAK